MEPELRFLAAVSHEIRNPTTSILGFTEMLLREELTPAENYETLESCRKTLKHCKETVKIVRNNAEFLLSLLNDVLDLSKLEAGKLNIEKFDVPLCPFLNDLSATFSIQATAKNLVFSVIASTPLPEIINTDPIRLRQILVNLIGNALKFTPQGEVAVSVSWIPYKNKNAGNLLFAVRDTGIGIPQQKLALLFTPFQQADVSTARHFGGSGLGLTISKQLIQLLNGNIAVESREGQGSTFSVTLPQRFNDNVRFISLNDPITTDKSVPMPNRSAFPLPGRKILLVEDDKDTQRLFSFVLQKAGAEIIVADNGQTALEIVSEHLKNGNTFDVILMDAEMPIMDGYTASRRIREIGYEKPIIALTAHAFQKEHQKFREAGCNGCITKPILRDALIAAVSEWC